MIAFKFSYDGTWLGGKIVIVAESEKYARAEAIATISRNDRDSLKLVSAREIEGPATIVYNDNGDY